MIQPFLPGNQAHNSTPSAGGQPFFVQRADIPVPPFSAASSVPNAGRHTLRGSAPQCSNGEYSVLPVPPASALFRRFGISAAKTPVQKYLLYNRDLRFLLSVLLPSYPENTFPANIHDKVFPAPAAHYENARCNKRRHKL